MKIRGRRKKKPMFPLAKTLASAIAREVDAGMISYGTQKKYTLVAVRLEQFLHEALDIAKPRVRDLNLEAFRSYVEFRLMVGVKERSIRDEVSAINKMMEWNYCFNDIWLSSRDDLSFTDRDHITRLNRAIDNEVFNDLAGRLTEETKLIMHLQRSFALRFKESVLLDAKRALKQAKFSSKINILKGTKGGHARSVPIESDQQLALLELAAKGQRGKNCFIPKELSYIRFAQKTYREVSSAAAILKLEGKIQTGTLFHGNRHYYAQRLYLKLTGVECPIVAKTEHGSAHIQLIADSLNISTKGAKELDKSARQEISERLGHHRIEITNAYLG